MPILKMSCFSLSPAPAAPLQGSQLCGNESDNNDFLPEQLSSVDLYNGYMNRIGLLQTSNPLTEYTHKNKIYYNQTFSGRKRYFIGQGTSITN